VTARKLQEGSVQGVESPRHSLHMYLYVPLSWLGPQPLLQVGCVYAPTDSSADGRVCG